MRSLEEGNTIKLIGTSIYPVDRGIIKLIGQIETTEENVTIKLNGPIRMPVDDRVIKMIGPIGSLKGLEGY